MPGDDLAKPVSWMTDAQAQQDNTSWGVQNFRPSGKQSGQGARSFADVMTAPPAQAKQKVKPFNDLAKDFDPMMPQEQYDAIRHKYFNDNVAPRIPNNFSVMATRDEFLKATEREHLINHPTVAKLGVGALATTEQLLQPLKDLNPQARSLYNATKKKSASLSAAMQRDGISATGPKIAGDLIGSGIAFAGIEAATDGAGSAAGVDELLAGVAQAGKTAALAAKLSKGALAFGTYEALTDEGKHRGYAFAKGAAMGAAFDGSFTLLGKLARGGIKITPPEEIEKELGNALSPDPKPMSPVLDRTVADHIKTSQEQARAEGKPYFVRPDEDTTKTRVMGTDGKGQPFTLFVEPDGESRTIDALKEKLAQGGSVDGVLYHPTDAASFNKFAKMTKDLGLVPQVETKVMNVAEGQAKKVAASMNVEHIPAEPVGESKVHFEMPKPQTPNLTRIRSDLFTHELPDGTRFGKGEIWDYAKRIKALWEPTTSLDAKEATANQLVGKGLEKFIPEEWHRTVEEVGVEGAEHEPDEILDPRQKELEDIYKQTIEEHERQVPSKFGQLGAEFSEPGEGIPGFSVTKQPMAKLFEDKAPAYLRKTFSVGKKGEPIEVTQRGDRVTMRVSSEQMAKMLPNARAFIARGSSWQDVMREMGHTQLGGYGEAKVPVEVYSKGATRDTLYHEGLHVQLTPLANQLPDIFGQHGSALQIAKWLRDNSSTYTTMSHAHRLEEAYIYAATAIRHGDKEMIENLGAIDTSATHVIDMVDASSIRILESLRTKVSTQEARATEERMYDLLRRTGRQRLERWQDGAARAGHDLYYDAEGDAFVLASAREHVSIGGKSSVADHIEQAQGAAEYVPDDSIIFQQRGVKMPMATLNGLPYSAKNVPMAELTPHQDRFKGLMTASAMLRPMQDWAASVEQRFEKAGQKIGLFDKYKDVDDAVRVGQEWLNKSYASAAKFLSGDAARLKTMFEFLSADPKHWDRMAPKFNVDKDFLNDTRAANQWLTDFRDSTGIQVFNYLRNDLSSLRGFNFDTGLVYGRGIKDEAQMSFFHKAIVNGDLNPRDGHAGRFINFLLREGFNKKFTDAPIAELSKILRKEDRNGMSVLGTLRFPVQNYINYVKGIPDASQQIITKSIGDFQKNLAQGFKQANKYLPKKYQLTEEFNYPGTLFNRMVALSYAAGTGGRPIIAARDMIQVITNTLPILGPAKMLEGLRKGLTAEGFAEARRAGALLEAHNVQGLYGDIFHEMPPHSGGTLDKAMDVANALMAPSRWGHNFGRNVAYHGEYGAALKAVRAYREGRIDVRKLFEDTSMWFFPKPLQTRLMRDVLTSPQQIEKAERTLYRLNDLEQSQGASKALTKKIEAARTNYNNLKAYAKDSKPISDEEVAKKIALETVDSTLWSYRRGQQPMALRTGLGRIFGQYGMWPLNYAEFLRKSISKGAEYPSKTMRMMALWTSSNFAASQTLGAIGGDVNKWFFLSPAGYGGSEHLKLAQDIMKAPEESDEGRQARKDVLEYPMNFVPGSVEMEAIIKAVESGEPMFDGNGAPTDSLVHVLGMKPKKEHMQDLTPEEWMQYESGFKGGRRQ
jgi:hypothetical protein